MGSAEFGELRLVGTTLWIVDYQHRWRGFQKAINDFNASTLSSFTIPVTIIADIPRDEEIYQFYVINSKQKKVDSDLGLALIQTLAQTLATNSSGGISNEELKNLVGPGNYYKIRAALLTFLLSERNLGPWVGKIEQPHDLRQPNATISIKSFVASLEPVLSKKAACSKLSDDDLLNVLVNFWSALETIVPDSFADPKSVIQRTIGTYAFHLVFARKLYPQLSEKGDTSVEAFYKALQPAAPFYITVDFWKQGAKAKEYSGSGGYRNLAGLIMAKLAE